MKNWSKSRNICALSDTSRGIALRTHHAPMFPRASKQILSHDLFDLESVWSRSGSRFRWTLPCRVLLLRSLALSILTYCPLIADSRINRRICVPSASGCIHVTRVFMRRSNDAIRASNALRKTGSSNTAPFLPRTYSDMANTKFIF